MHRAHPEEACRGWLVGCGTSSFTPPELQRYGHCGAQMPLGVVDEALRKHGLASGLLVTDTLSQPKAFKMGCAHVPYDSGIWLVYDRQRTHLSAFRFLADVESVVGAASALAGHAIYCSLAGGDCIPDEVEERTADLVLPQFCHSVTGTCDCDGLPHGRCRAELAHSALHLDGMWQNGLPSGQCVLRSKAGIAFELDTETPTAADYGLSCTRISPGYLWPRQSLAHDGARILTIRVDGEAGERAERSYRLAVSGSTRSTASVSLQCIDQVEGTTGNGALPPRAASGQLENCVYVGKCVSLCLRVGASTSESVIFVGEVYGTATEGLVLPFARSGYGTQFIPDMSRRGDHKVHKEHYI